MAPDPSVMTALLLKSKLTRPSPSAGWRWPDVSTPGAVWWSATVDNLDDVLDGFGAPSSNGVRP